QQEEVDPEDAADFEREFSRMMAESMESRKFERKPQFDVPIPVAAKNRGHPPKHEEEPKEASEAKEAPEDGPGKMAFSLLTKKGKGQQVSGKRRGSPRLYYIPVLTILVSPKTRTVELPSDSGFAVAMRNQQQAEREEQQRIKNLVLNYEIRESEDQDGWEPSLRFVKVMDANGLTDGVDRPANFHYNRKAGPKDRGGQRVRKLQLSDVEW
ncbi:hypothetical protein IMZ48_39480, partial [Candidatus Bathyarchaeota archaeon]|nr:hypothetical protein [Candidatus Bathyarchaeota archaeon]